MDVLVILFKISALYAVQGINLSMGSVTMMMLTVWPRMKMGCVLAVPQVTFQPKVDVSITMPIA